MNDPIAQHPVWALLEGADPPVERRAPTAAEIVARAGVRDLPVPRRASARRPAPPARLRFGLAGGLIAATLAAATLGFPLLAPTAPRFGAVEFIAGPHEDHTIRLEDGTVVRLQPGSHLVFDGDSPRERRVTFEGVGYFAVARDEKRPFVIRTAAGDAEVLGTRFELRTERDAMRVVVVEGTVAMEALGRREKVTANQMGRAGPTQPPVVVDVEDVNDFIGWTEGMLVFQATPLSSVADELAKHYDVQISIANEALARREVTAWLQEQSFHAAMTAVCGAVGARCTMTRDGATMELRQ